MARFYSATVDWFYSALDTEGRIRDLVIEFDRMREANPLFLHRRYTRDEILVGLGLAKLVGPFNT
jgi:hypothetical protein